METGCSAGGGASSAAASIALKIGKSNIVNAIAATICFVRRRIIEPSFFIDSFVIQVTLLSEQLGKPNAE